MIKRLSLIIISALLTQGCVTSSQTGPLKSPTQVSSCPVIETCFTPGQDCTHKITAVLTTANHSILVQAYSFTSKPIVDALIYAKNKDITVKVILDKSQLTQRFSLLNQLVNAGIPVWIDNKPAIAHNKIMIIDEKEVITGSFNFSDAAQKKNAENLVFITDPQVAKAYMQNWENRKRQSIVYSHLQY
jgi:phosphatidylserine/phosphatidylglycerophosphate/cardiolipin synthase-like enzyme